MPRHADAGSPAFGMRSGEAGFPAALQNGRGGAGHSKEALVQLIVYYVVFMILGDLAAYGIGLVVERNFGNYASLIVFLALYFLFLWIAWLLAVWFTEPKRVQPAAAA
jgi:hypothetical protein